MILGVGVGTLEEEFDLLGAPFDDRGAAADDAIRALRAACRRRDPTYEGDYYEFGGLVVDPRAARRTCRSGSAGAPALAAAGGELADGWAPFRLSPERISELLARSGRRRIRRRPRDPAVGPDRATLTGPAGQVETMVAAGATIINAVLHHLDCEHLVAQLGALRDLYPQAQWRAGASE